MGSFLCKLIWQTLSATFTADTTLVTVLTLERILAVYKPMVHRQYAKSRLANIMCMAVVVYASLLAAPNGLFMGIKGDSGRCARIDIKWVVIYQITSRMLISTVIPLVAVVLGNIMVLTRVMKRSHDKQVPTMGRNCSNSEARITRMLIAVSLMFSLCYVSSTIIGLAFIRPITTNAAWAQRYFLYSLANLMALINSSSNFFLYIMTNNKFKRHLKIRLGMPANPSRGRSSVGQATTQM